jgi:taurine dioxygenase
MTQRIGAEIFGVDLSHPTDDDIAAISSAIANHQVVFFRDQPLAPRLLIELGKHFGELAIHSGVAGMEDFPEVVKIHADEHSRYVAGEGWHSDLTCDPAPPMGSILYLHTVPDGAGDTVFTSMYAAYDALSDRMKNYLDGLVATHDGNHVYKALFPDLDKSYPCNDHPVVRTHPVTGRRALFVNQSYTTGIVGLPKDESTAVLEYLYRHCTNPNFQVRFRWEPHSVAFWDNRCTLHMAVWDYFPQTRSGYRVTIAGDVPV